MTNAASAHMRPASQTCEGADQQCVQFFDPAMLPADDPLLVIGVCGLP